MITIIDCEQNSPEWYEARRGIITASEFHKVLAKGAEGKTRKRYMQELAYEEITGQIEEGFSNRYTDRGHKVEPEARELYEIHSGNQVVKCGFIKNGAYGCSPDGLVDDDGIAEFKSRMGYLQVDLLLRDRVPPEHTAQIQGLLFVSGRKWVDFVSFCPGLPLFKRRVERDEPYIEMLEEELEKFRKELNEMKELLLSKY